MKHYYFESITPWNDIFILWYRLGGKKRGTLEYKLGTLEELERYSADMIGRPADLGKAVKA